MKEQDRGEMQSGAQETEVKVKERQSRERGAACAENG